MRTIGVSGEGAEVDETPTVVMGDDPEPLHPRHAETGQDGDGRKNRLMVFLVVVVLLLACAVTGLAVAMIVGRESEETASTTASARTTTLAESRGSGSGGGVPTPSEQGGGGTTGSDTPGEDQAITDEPPAPCTASAVSATIGGSISGTPVNVTNLTCTSSGAHAWALLTLTMANVDPVYAYFRDVGGGWELLDYGTGISCGDVGIPASECAELP